jgi:hypothetical protein
VSRPFRLLEKGIRDPRAIPPYLRRLCGDIRYGFRYRNTPHQKHRIADFIQNDRFSLVILDSCRYDYFSRAVADHIPGKLEKVYTPSTATVNYIQRIWDDYYDITYVTGMPAPTDHAFERRGLEYRPSEHFREFVHVWRSCDGKELGAVPPESMTAAALSRGDDQMIVHYVQPHAPYIGDHRLRDPADDESLLSSLQEIYRKIGRYDLSEKTISDADLRDAYRSNLERALRAVRHLVERVDRPVVVTADHGELLGEDGRYIHGYPKHPLLCEVPWFVVDESVIGTVKSKSEDQGIYSRSEVTEEDIEDQLKALGYV